jgi:hypothetical protein
MATTHTNVGLSIFSNKVIVALRRKLAPIFAFSLDLSAEAKQPGDKVRVPLIGADAAGDFDASTNNYKATKSDLTDREVSINVRKIAKFGIDDAQAASHSPHWWERKAEANSNAVARAALIDILGLITGANYGDADADKVAIALSAMNLKGAAAIRAAAVKKNMSPALCALVLNSDYFSALLGCLDSAVYGGSEVVRTGVIPNLLGFGRVIEAPDLTTCNGFVCPPDALAVANRYLAPVEPRSYQEVGSATDEDSGLTVGVRRYGDPDTGLLSVSTEICYGREIGNAAALLRIM